MLDVTEKSDIEKNRGENSANKAIKLFVEKGFGEYISFRLSNGHLISSGEEELSTDIAADSQLCKLIKDKFIKHSANKDNYLFKEIVIENIQPKEALNLKFPKLFSTVRGPSWKGSKKNISLATQYLKIEGFGSKGKKQYGNPVTSPIWWRHVPYDWTTFTGPSKAPLHISKEIIEAILRHYDINIAEHVENESLVANNSNIYILNPIHRIFYINNIFYTEH